MWTSLQILKWYLVLSVWGAFPVNGEDSQPEVSILKQINRVNDDGSYTFGYEATDGSFKIETRDVLGNIKGMFGFIDENGELKRVSYTANNGTGFQASGNIGNSPTDKVISSSGYATVEPSPTTDSVTRRPVLILKQPQDVTRSTTRGPVIQHIPRKSLVKSSTSQTTTPVYGEYISSRRPHPVTEDIFVHPNDGTTTTSVPQVTENTTPVAPVRRILISKKLVEEKSTKSKGGNALRRQLTRDPESRSDTADVYSGGDTTPRFIPTQSSRPPLPPHLLTAYRNQLLAQNTLRETTTQYPPYRQEYNNFQTNAPFYEPNQQYLPTPFPPANRNRIPIPLPALPVPGSIPQRPAVIDEQQYPVQNSRRYNIPVNRPPEAIRPVYQPEDDANRQPPFPVSAYRSLRDELMEYLLQYLQYRTNRINPYVPNNYPNQYPNPNPYAYPIPGPYGYNPYINPNVINPYINQNIPFPRQPFPNPYGLNPQDFGYPNYPQQQVLNVPNVSPNIQYSGQQYSSNPQYVPRGYDPQLPVEDSQRTRPTQATTEAANYQLPPAQLLRMLIARGMGNQQYVTSTPLPTLESYTSTTQSTTTKQPVRNVQIVNAESSVSSVIVKAPSDGMEMQA